MNRLRPADCRYWDNRPEALCLSAIELAIAFGVVAYQNLQKVG